MSVSIAISRSRQKFRLAEGSKPTPACVNSSRAATTAAAYWPGGSTTLYLKQPFKPHAQASTEAEVLCVSGSSDEAKGSLKVTAEEAVVAQASRRF